MATQLESTLHVSDLILQASPVVQLVMLLLLFASLYSWYLIAKLHMSCKKAQADDEHFQKIFWSGAELNTLYNNAQLNSKRVGLEDIFYQGLGEFFKLKKRSAAPAQTIDGTERILRVSLSRDQSNLEQGLGALASIGSVAPYVGLFGTVWGIMNAFIGLADVDQVTLGGVLHHVLVDGADHQYRKQEAGNDGQVELQEEFAHGRTGAGRKGRRSPARSRRPRSWQGVSARRRWRTGSPCGGWS